MLEKIKQDSSDLQKEFGKRSTGYIIAAFGLVAGLAWNEAIKALIEELFPSGENSLLAKFIYAAVITLVLVFITIYVNKIIARKEETELK